MGHVVTTWNIFGIYHFGGFKCWSFNMSVIERRTLDNYDCFITVLLYFYCCGHMFINNVNTHCFELWNIIWLVYYRKLQKEENKTKLPTLLLAGLGHVENKRMRLGCFSTIINKAMEFTCNFTSWYMMLTQMSTIQMKLSVRNCEVINLVGSWALHCIQPVRFRQPISNLHVHTFEMVLFGETTTNEYCYVSNEWSKRVFHNAYAKLW